MSDKDLLVTRIKAMQAQTLSLHSELMSRFMALSLYDKIDIYCESYREGSHKLFDTFLSKELYYSTCEGVSLYDDLFWERYETMTLSDVFDWVTDSYDDDDEMTDHVQLGQTSSHRVLRDMLTCGIGTAVRDW